MCAADIAERVNHRQHNEAEGERDANVRNRAAADFIDDDCARPGKHEGERAKEFSAQWPEVFHF